MKARIALLSSLLVVALSVPARAQDPTAAGTSPSFPTSAPGAPGTGGTTSSFLEEFPSLGKYRYDEPTSGARFGFGIAPVEIMKNKIGVALNILSVNWVSERLDFEIFNATFGTTLSSQPETNLKHFTFRAAPKYRVTEVISIGPLVGLEFVSFPDVNARVFSNNLFTPVESFTSRGLIYGLAVSETFKGEGDRARYRFTQLVYKQNYSTTETSEGWRYFYTTQDALNDDSTPIGPGVVMVMEFSFLY